MGSGGIAGLAQAAQSASDEDLLTSLRGIDEDKRRKIAVALEKVRLVPVTAEVLAKQNSETSQAVLSYYASDPLFQNISDRLTNEIMQRDKEDGDKLGKGIQMAVEKGVLPANVDVEPTKKVSVSGRSADVIADEIIAALGDASSKGCVLVLQGLSGTGKGTTVAKLKEKLPNAQTWSNGNIFRSITLLAVTWAEQEGKTLQDALQPDKLKEFCGLLDFDKFGSGAFDVKIEGLGLKYFVSEVEKTVLKDSKVATNIPTVAEVTQGECVKFVSDALSKMAAAGINVLVEGREQTLNHIRSPHRFELVLDNNAIIGQRQAALQVSGKAWDEVGKSTSASQTAVDAAIKKALGDLARVSIDALSKQNSDTSQAILTAYAGNPLFQYISEKLTREIMQRDKEDGDKLGKGIQMAVDKGVLPVSVNVEPTMKVGVSGRTADQVANEIVAALGDAPSKGCVLILQGLSGTGKGTTVAKLQEKLPNAQPWSNGNIFRSITLLAVTWAEQEGKTLEDALKPDKLKEFCGMLEFNKFDGKSTFDVKIEGLGLKHFVSEVEKTVLKDSKIGKNIPTVAEVTQGECIKFVSDALGKMAAAGINVLVEGREQTLNHIRSPHRFELVLANNLIIGQRQAALQVGGKAWDEVGKSTSASQDAVNAAIKNALLALAKVTADMLSKQDSQTSQAILTAYAEDPLFQKIAERLTSEIMQRDREDGDKLGKGIDQAVDKGVLPAKVEVEPTKKVSVSGRTADNVADEIIKALGDAPSRGCVLVLQGLSGTGKGTTVAKLKEKLPNAQTWSNGNIFRSITLLAVTWAEQEGKTVQDALAPEKLKEFCAMLEFDKFAGKTVFDVKIEGLGLKYFVSEVEKTVLKDSKVATNIPTVAEVTQGECVLFVSAALGKMSAAGINVLVEGREQTLNHIRSPHRFELVLDNNLVIGQRQAALQVGGKAWEAVGKSTGVDQATVDAAIKDAISALAI